MSHPRFILFGRVSVGATPWYTRVPCDGPHLCKNLHPTPRRRNGSVVEDVPTVLIPLTVLAHSAYLPDFHPGAVFQLALNSAGAMVLTIPCSPDLLRRLSDAIHAGVLEVGPHGPGGTALEEIDAHVLATRDEMLAQLTALVGPPQPGGDPHSSLTAA